jgi:hypothetical protein
MTARRPVVLLDIVCFLQAVARTVGGDYAHAQAWIKAPEWPLPCERRSDV